MMTDGAQLFSNLSGGTLTPSDVKQIWEEVKLNSKTLDLCAKPHQFTPHEFRGDLVIKYRCELCGGTLAAGDARWYIKGLEDAGHFS